MSNQKKILLALIISLVIAIGILAYIQGKNKAKAKEQIKEGEPLPNIPINATAPTANNGYPIVYNKYSDAVKPLQRVLGVIDDGIPGAKTLAALQKFYPSYTNQFSITSQTALDSIIDKIRTQKAANAMQQDTTNSNASRVKGIFYAVKKKGRKLVFTTTREHAKGYLDYQKVWHKTSGTVTINTGSKIEGNRVLGHSNNYLHIASNGQGEVLLVDQQFVIAQ